MNKKSLYLSLVVMALLVIIFIIIAYVLDTQKITTQADVPSDATAQELTSLPAPDQSTISKIYTAIVNVFK